MDLLTSTRVYMNISYDLYSQWKATCIEIVGIPLPINKIGIGMLAFEVRVQDPPLITRSGEAIRMVQLTYKLKDLKNEIRS
jgi:hypothetical protein